MRVIGRGPWTKNPNYCGICFNVLQTMHGGAEIECTLLFADVRGSTALAEQMSPRDFNAVMTRFYTAAAKELVERDGIVDKFVGDEVVAIFIPALAGEKHAQRAIEAARVLLRVTGNEPGIAPWLPVGAGIHSGMAYVGAVGEGQHTEFSALGDVVNVAARLASAASAGEIFVSTAAAAAATLDISQLEHRSLGLRGKSTATDIVVLSATAGA
jgi:adenylate cyclase